MSGEVVRVVLRPELIGGAFLDADCRRVLMLWRDGIVRPVVSRELLVRYLKVLREMGLGPELLRRWSLWFTSEERVIYVGELGDGNGGAGEFCAAAAEKGGTGLVIGWHKVQDSKEEASVIEPKTARDFLAEINSGRYSSPSKDPLT